MKSIKKGITLLEIIIAMILMIIIIVFVTSFFGTIIKNIAKSNDEFSMQSTMRVFGQSIKKELINAPTVYLIDKEQFTDGKIAVSPFWNYLGVKDIIVNGKESSQLVWYLFDKDTNTHREVNVTQPVENITYSAFFKKKTNTLDENMISFKLEGFINNTSGIPNEVIESLITAQNASQIIDWSRDGAVAIAYRSDELEITGEEGFRGAGMVSLVLDASNSMSFDMDGNRYPWSRDQHRSYPLRQSMEKLITSFSGNDNMFFALFPFSTQGFDVHENISKDAKKGFNNSYGRVFRLSNTESTFGENDLEDLFAIFSPKSYKEASIARNRIHRINSVYTDIAPSGWTNVGDGLRYARSFKGDDLKNIEKLLGLSGTKDIKTFMILLTDGEATSYSYIKVDSNFNLEDYKGKATGGINSGGSSGVMEKALLYAEKVAETIQYNAPFNDYYFIALSNDIDTTSFNNIAKGFGLAYGDDDFKKTHMFDANTIEELDLAFGTIFEDINMNMDYLLGPAR